MASTILAVSICGLGGCPTGPHPAMPTAAQAQRRDSLAFIGFVPARRCLAMAPFDTGRSGVKRNPAQSTAAAPSLTCAFVWAPLTSEELLVETKGQILSAFPPSQGLYDPRNEHDSCGVGFVANIKGRKSQEVIACGLEILVNLNHRGAVGADPLVGDGAGCLIQIPDALLRDWASRGDRELPPSGDYAVAMCFLPPMRKRANSPSVSSSASSAWRARDWSAGARSRPIPPALARRSSPRCR